MVRDGLSSRQLTRVQYPGGRVVEYHYDAGGHAEQYRAIETLGERLAVELFPEADNSESDGDAGA